MRSFILLILVAFTCTVVTVKVFAQDAPIKIEIMRMGFKARNIISPAPEAAELGKYGNTPVSLFTGAPNISIPLYELKGNSLSLPVSLNFSAAGFKPQESPTWVGQNWSLNAGGVITRSVRGNPDDEHYFNGSLTMPSSRDVFAWNDMLKDIKKGEREMEPDLYFYNFSGTAGKFIVTPDRTIVKKERNMLDISPGCITCGDGITIKDEQGNQYYFNDKEATRMQLGDDEQPDGPTVRNYTYNSSWYLTSITSADGREKMQLEYYYTIENALDANNQSRMISRTYSNNLDMGPPVRSSTSIDGSINGPTGPFTWARRKFLKKITFTRDGKTVAYIDFISISTRGDADFAETRMLQGINIYAGAGLNSKLVKKFTMGYGYYENSGNTYTKKRLRLDSLREEATIPGTVSLPPYLFDYYSNSAMPEKFSNSLDHWGFYNNAGNSSLIPTIDIEGRDTPASLGENANREPDIIGSSFGMIKKITYPTNGYTTFEYELHNALTSEDKLRQLGGVRIKRIIDYAANNQQATAKEYTYLLDNGKSSGKSDETYPRYMEMSTFTNYDPKPKFGTYLQSSATYSVFGTSIFGLGTFQGGHVSYSTVTETQVNMATNQSLGKTVYKYHQSTLNEFDEDIANGDLEKKTIYDGMGNLQYEQLNEYKYKTLSITPAIQAKPMQGQSSLIKICKKTGPDGLPEYMPITRQADTPPECMETRLYINRFYANTYSFQSQEKLLAKQTVKNYDLLSGSYIINAVKNSYDNPTHIYPTTIAQYAAGTEEVVTRKKYAADYTGGTEGQDGGTSRLNQNNIKRAEIETYQYRQDTTGTNKRIINGTVTLYGSDLQPVRIYNLQTAAPLSTFQESGITTAALTMDPAYKLLASFSYSNGVIAEQQKDKDVIKSYVWNYNNQYPTAEVINSKVTDVAHSSFETADLINGGWTLSNTTSNTTVAYTGSASCNLTGSATINKTWATPTDKGMIVSCWLQSGTITVSRNNSPVSSTGNSFTRNDWRYYEYRLPAGVQQITITGSNAVLDELRCYPEDAQMTTYTYTPLVGMTSQTAPNNMTTYYEYDGLNRLVNARDEKGNIRQNITYNYGPGAAVTPGTATLFYNNAAEKAFTKNNCTIGEPTTVIYKVPYGKYISSSSQAAADMKAQQELTASGQAYANNNGQCLFFNKQVSRRYFKNDCPPSVGVGSIVTYTVPARKWSTPIDQATADALAQQDLTDNGQNYANQVGQCTCSGEGKKIVKGNCETGTKMYQSSSLQSNGQYLCTYNYTFSDGSTSPMYSEYSNTACPIL